MQAFDIHIQGVGMKAWEHKGKQPNRVQNEMDAWRAGFGPISKAYIRYHKDAAEKALLRTVRKYDLKVLKTRMGSDGWMDGMRVLHAVTETPSGEILKLRWRDSHGNGTWFREYNSGGAGMLFEKELA